MSKEDDNKAVVGRWFTEFWGRDVNLAVVDEIAAPDMLLKYSLHAPRRGRDDIKAFMTDFRAAFPDLNFWGTADLIAEGDTVVGQWEGGGTHTGPAFKDFLVGSLPAATGRKMRFTGTTVLKVIDGRIAAEVGLDDGVTALTQLACSRPPDPAENRRRRAYRIVCDRAIKYSCKPVGEGGERCASIWRWRLLSPQSRARSAEDDGRPTAILVRPIHEAQVVRGDDGMDHVEYELLVVSVFSEPVTLSSVTVLDPDGKELMRIDGGAPCGRDPNAVLEDAVARHSSVGRRLG